MERDTKQEIIRAVEGFFEQKGAKYEPFDERGVARARYGVMSKIKGVSILFIASEHQLVLQSMLPVEADEESRAKVGEFLMRANYGFRVGCFDYDYRDGDISFRVSHYCGDEEFIPPTYEQIDYMLMLSLAMVSKYGDGLLKVLLGVVEPEDAIKEIES